MGDIAAAGATKNWNAIENAVAESGDYLETIANFLQALAEDKTSASLLKSVSRGTKPSQLFAHALLLNDMSARFFQMFCKRR